MNCRLREALGGRSGATAAVRLLSQGDSRQAHSRSPHGMSGKWPGHLPLGAAVAWIDDIVTCNSQGKISRDGRNLLSMQQSGTRCFAPVERTSRRCRATPAMSTTTSTVSAVSVHVNLSATGIAREVPRQLEKVGFEKEPPDRSAAVALSDRDSQAFTIESGRTLSATARIIDCSMAQRMID